MARAVTVVWWLPSSKILANEPHALPNSTTLTRYRQAASPWAYWKMPLIQDFSTSNERGVNGWQYRMSG